MPLKTKKTAKSKQSKKSKKPAAVNKPARKKSKKKVKTPNQKLVILHTSFKVREGICTTHKTITAQVLFNKIQKTATLLKITGFPLLDHLPTIAGKDGNITGCTLSNITHFAAFNTCMLNIVKRVYQEFK